LNHESFQPLSSTGGPVVFLVFQVGKELLTQLVKQEQLVPLEVLLKVSMSSKGSNGLTETAVRFGFNSFRCRVFCATFSNVRSRSGQLRTAREENTSL
jgi:hypothetical protein